MYISLILVLLVLLTFTEPKCTLEHGRRIDFIVLISFTFGFSLGPWLILPLSHTIVQICGLLTCKCHGV